MQGMSRLTLETVDCLLEGIAESAALDLRDVRFMDPYALLLLQLAIVERKEAGRPIDIVWPRTRQVGQWMREMGLWAGDTTPARHSPRDVDSALQPITRIEQESGIGRVVEGFHHRLAKRYPLTESSRRALIAVLIELFQNIPHHSNATGTVQDPYGIAAMQDYDGAIFVTVADKGIGLAASLGLRDGYQGIRDAQALDVVFHQGISRFNDPGRGGELRRIADLVRSWDGTFALRTGQALYYFDPKGGDTYDVPAFSGVQLALRLPARAFL